jgi:hypothetical protein
MLGDKEQGDASGSLWRTGESSQHTMNDIGCEVMFTAGNEDLCSGDFVLSISSGDSTSGHLSRRMRRKGHLNNMTNETDRYFNETDKRPD